MAKKKKLERGQIKLKSASSTHVLYTCKKREVGSKLVLKKYDPIVRKHVEFREFK